MASSLNVYDYAAAFRRGVMADEAEYLTAVAQDYGTALTRAKDGLAVLNRQVSAARAAGTPISRSWLYQQERYKTLVAQINADLEIATARASAGASALAVYEAKAGARNAVVMAAAALPGPEGAVSYAASFASVPEDAMFALTSMFGGAASPLSTYFGLIAPAIRDALTTGLALGHSTATIARRLDGLFGVGAARASLIARTEVMRAYREGARLGMLGNRDILEGWVWRSARTSKTCAICWSMDGTLYPFDPGTSDYPVGDLLSMTPTGVRSRGHMGVPPMDTHPGCRCALVPRAKSLGELTGEPGLRDRRPPLTSGANEFRKLTPAQQLRILGKARYDELAAGHVRSIRDFIDFRTHPVFGRQPFLKPFAEVRTLPFRVGGYTGALNNVAVGQSRAYWNRQILSAAERKQANERMAAVLENGTFAMRRTVRSSNLILQDGRFKTQFETGTSGGALWAKGRQDTELTLFNYPASLAPVERPLYGYLRGVTDDEYGVTYYGEVLWNFKASVKQRSTFYVGDSLGANPSNGGTALPFDHPEPLLASSEYGAKDVIAGRSSRFPMSYVEVQYHGGLTLEDVESVIFTGSLPSIMDDADVLRLIEALDRAGIPWTAQRVR